MAKEPTPTTEPATAEPTLASVLALLAKIQGDNVAVAKEQLRQTRHRSNQQGALRSPFNPRGDKDYPLPDLQCEVWLPFKITNPQLGGLDREEVELINKLKPGEFVIEMNDGVPQQVCVVGTLNSDTGKLYKLALLGPRDEDGNHTGLFTKDRLARFPPLKSILRQIIGEDASADVMTMREEVRRIHLPTHDPKYLPISLGE